MLVDDEEHRAVVRAVAPFGTDEDGATAIGAEVGRLHRERRGQRAAVLLAERGDVGREDRGSLDARDARAACLEPEPTAPDTARARGAALGALASASGDEEAAAVEEGSLALASTPPSVDWTPGREQPTRARSISQPARDRRCAKDVSSIME